MYQLRAVSVACSQQPLWGRRNPLVCQTNTNRKPQPSPPPASPPQFFQKDDSTMQDAITLGMALTLLYVAYKAYATLFAA